MTSSPSSLPTPKPGILDIAPYVGGRAHVAGVEHTIKLSSNESALGPSAAAREAFLKAAERMDIYPDGGAKILRDAVSAVHGVDGDRLVFGNGSDELIELLCAAYLGVGDEAVISQYAFSIYGIYTKSNGAKTVYAPEKDYKTDVDAMLSSVTDKTRIVFLANPNNPTGYCLPYSEVRRLHAGLPGNVLLVLDAAYAEFVRRNDYEAGIEMVSQFDNVVMTRTFSKVYALAGLRIGWAYCPAAVADVLNRIRAPFNLSVPAQAAGAAAMYDRAHIALSVEHNDRWRAWLLDAIRALGLRVDESAGNFLLIHFPHMSGKTAHDADAFLCRNGLILRGMDSYGLSDCLRLTVGREDANRKVVAALKEFMERS